MSPYAVIFDIDGVLIDSYDAHFQSWKRLCAEHDVDLTESRFAASFGRTSRDIIRMWWGDGVADTTVGQMDARKEAHFRDIVRKDFPQMPGASELIAALHDADFRLAAGSSGPPENVALVLELLDPQGRFAARVTGADVTRGKPDPQVFLMAAQRLGVAPAQCAVIEDAVPGVAAANAAGMVSIALTGTAQRDALVEADHVVDSLSELKPQVIASLIAEGANG